MILEVYIYYFLLKHENIFSDNLEYLVNLKGNKEDETVNRLFAKAKGLKIPTDDTFESFFGLNTDFCLVGLRIPFDYIDESLTGKLDGDIDLFFLQLSTNISDYLNPIKKIPSNTQIIAFEVLTGYLNKKREIKSSGLFIGREEKAKSISKTQKRYRAKAEKLGRLGFNKVGLLYLFPTTPESDICYGIDSWLAASDEIKNAKKIINPLFHKKSSDTFSTCYRFISAIPEGLEHQRGMIDSLTFVNKVPLNPVRNKKFQDKLIHKIKLQLPFDVNPNLLPILFLACGNRNCKNLYLSPSDPYLRCPICNHTPTGNYENS